MEERDDILDITVDPKKYEEIETEYNILKTNLMDAAKQINDKLPEIIELALSAQNPKMYESLSKMIDSIAKVNQAAGDLVKKRQDLYDSLNMAKEDNTPAIQDNSNSNMITINSNDLLHAVLNSDKNEER